MKLTCMPLFFFHLRDPGGIDRDEEGLECPDLEAAYLNACRAIPDMAADLLRNEKNPALFAFEIADAQGNVLLDVPFTEMVRGRQKQPAARSRGTSPHVEHARDLVEVVLKQVASLQHEMQVSLECIERIRLAVEQSREPLR